MTNYSNTDLLYQRRAAVVPKGLGIFSPASATSAHGAIVKDADGRELIDFAGGIGVMNVGHCPEKVVKAIQEQAARLMHTCFNVAIYEPYLALAEKLVSILPHGEATKVMLTNTGAEAVENAIKIARQATGRPAVICFEGAFHGRSMMAMTLTSKVGYKQHCGPYAPEVYRIPFPYYQAYQENISEEAFGKNHLADLEKYFNQGVSASQVAAIILEPVQGEGGFHVVSPTYLKGLRKICDKYGIMLILDEVQSGFGRTGKWAAYEHYDVIPDISTWAKSMGGGMPIGCVMGKAAIMDAAGPSTIGGTYPGNPVCAAAALATIEYMEEININELGVQVGIKVNDFFERLKSKFPDTIKAIHGLGAMLAIELVDQNGNPAADLTKKVLHFANENGLILISAGVNGNYIRILSPLVISDAHLFKGFEIIENAFNALL
jgi:4-aminobutyrate aminotransferase/(S)-3-amino-2-methylpropionate transaminase